MEAVEVIRCRGHENVRGMHKSTFEITKEAELSPQGDCIVGVAADKGAADLSPKFRELMAKEGAKLTAVFSAGGIEAVVTADGGAGISLTHPTDLVWRRSSFVCPRTIGIYSDTTAALLPRELIEILKTGAEMTVTLTVTVE
ncbi:MAG: DUF371 domain-containing protein [Methanocorpusculum sp.]|nr:DUF371 domain-containing protein [Methanocorpusculum sp.]